MVAGMKHLARLIIVQFNSTNSSVFPSWIRLNTEAPKKPGQGAPSGTLIAGPADNVSVSDAIDQIVALGYEMVDAYRRHVSKPKDHNAIYFLFSPHEHAKLSEDFKEDRGKVFAELRKLSAEANWSVVVFDNPFFTEGAEVAGERALAVNCMARKPLLENGQPIMVWPKGFSKDNPGTGKVPFGPSDDLSIRLESEAVEAAA